MRKPQLISTVAQYSGLDESVVQRVLNAFVNVVIDALKKDEEVTLTGFGTFSARVRKSRIGVNPRNPSQAIQIPSVKVAKFKAGKALKDALKANQSTNEGSVLPSGLDDD